MDTKKINKRFEHIEVIPGNGYSPYTGSLVFWCYDTLLNKAVTVKSSDGIRNKHRTIKEEYEFIKNLPHRCIVKALDYCEYDGVEYMIMDGEYRGGGRRERWCKIFNGFDEFMAEIFLDRFIHTLMFLQMCEVLHGDIECANMVYNPLTCEPIFIDFGRAEKRSYSWEWLVNQLRLDKVNKLNTFFREISNTGGVYANESRHFSFDIKPIIEKVLDNA